MLNNYLVSADEVVNQHTELYIEKNHTYTWLSAYLCISLSNVLFISLLFYTSYPWIFYRKHKQSFPYLASENVNVLV